MDSRLKSCGNDNRNTDRVLGFTFIELLLALSLYAVVLMIVAASLRGGLTVWERDESNSKRNFDLNLFWDKMAEEFENMVSLAPVPFVGKKTEIQMTTVTNALSLKKKGKQFVKVQYRLEGENLIRQEFNLLEVLQKKLSPKPAVSQVWLEGVRRFSFQYAYKGAKGGVVWKDDWKQEEERLGFPFGIKVALDMKQDKDLLLHAEKIFFVPDGMEKAYS